MSCHSYRPPPQAARTSHVPGHDTHHVVRNRNARSMARGIPGMLPGQLYTLHLKPTCGLLDQVTCVTIEEVECSALDGQQGSVFRLVIHDYNAAGIDVTNTGGHTHDKNADKTHASKRAFSDKSKATDPNAVAIHINHKGQQTSPEGCPVTQITNIHPGANGTLGAIVTFDKNGKCITLYATFVPQGNRCDPCSGGAASKVGWSGPDACGCCDNSCACACPCSDGNSGSSEETA